MTQVPARLQVPSKENSINPVNPFLGEMKAHSALFNVWLCVNLTFFDTKTPHQMTDDPQAWSNLLHHSQPIISEVLLARKLKQSFPQAVLSPMALASSECRAIPKPLQLKWHVPNGDPIVYGRVMVPFFWILFGSSGTICGTQLVSKLKRTLSCSVCLYFSPPFELLRDWDSASDSKEEPAPPGWKELEPRHPVCSSWETALCSQTPRGCQTMKSAAVQMPWVWGRAQHINSNTRFLEGSSEAGPDGSCCAECRQTLLCLFGQTGTVPVT